MNLFTVLVVHAITFYPPGTGVTCCFDHEKNYSYFGGCDITTCTQALDKEPRFCPQYIIETDYCKCEQGYYYNNCSQCVPLSECNKVCKLPPKPECNGPNEVLVDCLKPKDYRICPVSHSTPPPSKASFSPFLVFIRSNLESDECIPNVCNCAEGFLRNEWGDCVRECQCNVSREVDECPDPFEQVKGKTCVCVNGYKRNKCLQCIPENGINSSGSCLCTNLCPKKNSERRCFNSKCQRTCENLWAGKSDDCPISSKECNVGCDCAEGFYLNSTTNACVPPCQC